MLARFFLLLLLFSRIAISGILDFTPGGTQPGLEHSLLSPTNCQSCHRLGSESFSPFNSWSTSMMAMAGRDPLFWASLDVANNDLPGSGDFCLKCHAPAAWLGGRIHKTSTAATVNGTDGCLLQGNINERGSSHYDFEGVDCHFCHRLDPTGNNGETAKLENANFWIDDELCEFGGGEPCRKGPYKTSTANHAWEYSEFLGNSGFCGTCHNVTSPALTLINTSGVDTLIPFPIERTYKEWTLSRFGDYVFSDSHEATPDNNPSESCQSCHMPVSPDPNAYACNADAPGTRDGELPVHELTGGNSFILEILNGEYGAQLQRTDAFITTINKTLELLQTQSATLEVSASSNATQINANVKITNLTGHKLPTGYPEGRRMWVNVTLQDSSLTTIWESGHWDPASGTLANTPELKIYEALPGIFNKNGTNQCDTEDGAGNKIFHFVLNNCWVKDNRIPPEGFLGGNHLEIQPVNYSYPETSPGSGVWVNYDNTAYVIPIPVGSTGPYTVQAKLQYQTTSKDYVEFLRDQANTNNFADDCHIRTTPSNAGIDYSQPRGNIMYDMWEAYGKSAPVNLASDSISGL